VNLVFSPKNKVIVVFPTVGVIYMSERNQLDRLTLQETERERARKCYFTKNITFETSEILTC